MSLKRTLILSLTIVAAALLLLGIMFAATAQAETGIQYNPDGSVAYEYTIDTSPADPIWQRMAETGESYDYDAGEFVAPDAYSTHEGEADDPYQATANPTHSGTYQTDEGLVVVEIPANVPDVWW